MLSLLSVTFFVISQLLSGLREDIRLLLLILDNAVDSVYNGNIPHQSVLFGLSHWLLSHPVVRSRPASEADQNSLATVSYQLRRCHCSVIL